jgi:hypothetical protein
MRSGRDGTLKFTLVEDYFPQTWSSFKRRHKGELLLVAEYEVEQLGIMHGNPYKKIRFTSSLPWRYSPAKQSYTSYAAGLSVGGGSFLLTVFGIFIYRLKRKRPFQELVFDEKV